MDNKDFTDIVNILEKREQYIQSLDNKRYTSTDKVFTIGSHLHKETEQFSEVESAMFERDNKRVFDILLEIHTKLKSIVQE